MRTYRVVDQDGNPLRREDIQDGSAMGLGHDDDGYVVVTIIPRTRDHVAPPNPCHFCGQHVDPEQDQYTVPICYQCQEAVVDIMEKANP